MKYKVKDWKYVNNINVVVKYIKENDNMKDVQKVINGLSNTNNIPHDTLFEYKDCFYDPENCKYAYGIFTSDEYGNIIVREDNVEEIVEKEDTLNSHGIESLIKSGNKTILVEHLGNKYITTKHKDDKDDIEKAVMLLLLKREGYSVKEIYDIIDCVKEVK